MTNHELESIRTRAGRISTSAMDLNRKCRWSDAGPFYFTLPNSGTASQHIQLVSEDDTLLPNAARKPYVPRSFHVDRQDGITVPAALPVSVAVRYKRQET